MNPYSEFKWKTQHFSLVLQFQKEKVVRLCLEVIVTEIKIYNLGNIMMLSQKMNISIIFLPAYAKKILKNILEYPVCKNYFKVSPSLPLIQDDDEEEYAFLRYAKQS